MQLEEARKVELLERLSLREVLQMIHLAFLPPEIVRQITLGTQPVGLTSDWLFRHSLPTDWTAQHERIAHL